MNRRSFPLWLLRDVPAFLGFLCSFWPLMIFVITSGGKAARKGKASRNIYDRIAILLAHAESRLDFALRRQAYRRLGWSAHHIAVTPILPPDSWAATVARYRAYSHACRGMDNVVDTYVEHLRDQYRISQREAASATAHAPVRAATPLAASTKSSLAGRRGRWIAASSRRDGGGCAPLGTRARGPPHLFFRSRTNPPRRLHLRDRTPMPIRAPA
jgi:hypothetical protein